jgi:hypothetical protein
VHSCISSESGIWEAISAEILALEKMFWNPKRDYQNSWKESKEKSSRTKCKIGLLVNLIAFLCQKSDNLPEAQKISPLVGLHADIKARDLELDGPIYKYTPC